MPRYTRRWTAANPTPSTQILPVTPRTSPPCGVGIIAAARIVTTPKRDEAELSGLAVFPLARRFCWWRLLRPSKKTIRSLP